MSDNSFLPADYIAQQADRRTNIICLTLFAIIMLGVSAAFWVTNRQWNQVKAEQRVINARYETAGKQIEELTQLEEQKMEMLDKAELAGSLVERVPRSVLLAHLINRMPDRLSVVEFKLVAEKLKPVIDRPEKDGHKSLKASKAPTKAPTMKEAGEKISKVEPPRYKVKIDLRGVAPTDLEVSRYLAALNAFELVDTVRLEYSKEIEFDGMIMREFRMLMQLADKADVRAVDPLIPSEMKNPMNNEVRYNAPNTASVTDQGRSTPSSARTKVGD